MGIDVRPQAGKSLPASLSGPRARATTRDGAHMPSSRRITSGQMGLIHVNIHVSTVGCWRGGCVPEVGVGPLPAKGRTRSSARSRLRGLAYAPPTARTPRPALVQRALAVPSGRRLISRGCRRRRMLGDGRQHKALSGVDNGTGERGPHNSFSWCVSWRRIFRSMLGGSCHGAVDLQPYSPLGSDTCLLPCVQYDWIKVLQEVSLSLSCGR